MRARIRTGVFKSIIAGISLGVLCSAAPALAVSAKDIVDEFNQVDSANNLSQLIRSNAPHYWGYMKSAADLRGLKKYIGFEGVIAGDPHMGNFSVIPVKVGTRRQMRFLNIDFDDAGRGPLVLDFARLVIAAKATGAEIKKRTLESAYLMGLQGKQVSPPAQVEEILDLNLSDYDGLVDDYIDGKTTGDKFKLKPGKLETYNAGISRQVIAALFPGLTVLDLAMRPRERGGSTGLRIWVLTKDDQGRRLIKELKQYQTPGVSYYERQLDPAKWIAEVRAVFWPGVDPSSYDLVNIPGAGLFWLRDKRVSLIDVPYSSEKDSKLQFLQELEVYDANILGLAHGSQPAGQQLRRAIEADPDAFHYALEPVVKAYLDVARKAYEQ